VKRPDFVTDEHLEYLDELRESGVTNMYGAAAYVADEFDMDKRRAREVFTYWKQSFGSPVR